MMEVRHHSRRPFGVLLGAVLMAAGCNSLLDNHPRELSPTASGGGNAGTMSGALGGQAGAGGSASMAEGAGGSVTGGAEVGGMAGAAGAEEPTATTGNGTSTCADALPECMPGASEPDFQECACGGTQKRLNTCNNDCVWELGEWGPCEGIECVPGTQSAPEPCDCDSDRSRSRTCTESCTWGPLSSCDLGCGSAPASLPDTTTDIYIWTNAVGRSGTSQCCPQVGTSETRSNPQFVWCRRWGGLVSDDRGNHNHWWLWTEFDDPRGATGWISAYYIDGQGNDQAYGIPDCE